MINKVLKASPYILIVGLLVSLFVFIGNHGFKYSDFEQYFTVSVYSDNSSEILNSFENTSGLIEIDRNNNVLTFQHTDPSTIQQKIDSVVEQYPDSILNLATVYPSDSKREILTNLLLNVVLILTFFIGYSFVLKTRHYKWDLKQYSKYYSLYIVDNLLTVGILLGVVSLLSLVYKINNYVLFSVIFVLIFKTMIFWFKLLNEDIHQMKSSYVENFKSEYKKLFLIVFILVGLIAIGMGAKSVIPLLFIVISLLLSVVTDYSLLTVEIPRLRRNLDKENASEKKKQTKSPEILPVRKYIPKQKKKNKRK